MNNLSQEEYNWWCNELAKHLGLDSLNGIKLYKDEIGYMGKIYNKKDITKNICPIELIIK